MLLHCLFARELWAFIFVLFGVNWVVPKLVKELLLCWRRKPKPYKTTVQNVVTLCLMWTYGRKEIGGFFRGNRCAL